MASPTAISLILLFALLPGSTLARPRHVIPIPASASASAPVGLAWDPTAQHFLVGSRHAPATVLSISDAGVADTIISDDIPSPVAAFAVDDARRRLLVAVARPASLAAYDLRSPRPHRRIFLSPLPEDPSAAPGSVAVDPASGAAFVTAGSVVVKVDLSGNASVLSRWKISGGDLGGIAWVSGRDFLLVVEREKGRLFKLLEDRAAQEVLVKGSSAMGEVLAVRSDGGAVVAGEGVARWLKSNDGWSESVVYDRVEVGEGWRAAAAAVREGRRAYILVMPAGDEEMKGRSEEKQKERSRIEEVEWGKEGEGEMVWGLGLIGLGLVFVFFWRFQMKQLASNMNKKRA